MKAGVSCYCFNALLRDREIGLDEVIAFVGRQTKAECIELLSRYWREHVPVRGQAAAARELIADVNLEVSCYTLDSNFAVYVPTKFQACIDLCIEQLGTAVVLGADTIRLDPASSLPGPPAQADLDDVLRRICKGMQAITDAAAEKGITVGVENHGRLLGASDTVARMVELVDRPNFGVNIDFTNFRNVYGEDHVAATRKLAPHVVHAHAKDFLMRAEPQEGEGWRETPNGQYVKPVTGGDGDAGWPTLFGILKEAGFDGTIALEISDPADVHGSVARGAANLKRTIESLAG